MLNLNPATRKWIYGIIATTVPLLIAVGTLTDEIGAQLLNVAAAALAISGSALAITNVPKDYTMAENSASDNREWVEVLVAIGRIEEGIKGLRDSIERLDKKSNTQADDIQEMKMEIQQLKTSKNTTKENVALIASVLAMIVASISVLGVLGLV